MTADQPQTTEENGSAARRLGADGDELIETTVETDATSDRTEATGDTAPTATVIESRDLAVYYGDEQALQDVDIEIPEKQVTAGTSTSHTPTGR